MEHKRWSNDTTIELDILGLENLMLIDVHYAVSTLTSHHPRCYATGHAMLIKLRALADTQRER